MSHATPKHLSGDPFAITVERPIGLTDEEWDDLKKQIADICAPAVLELLGRCATHPWCIAAGTVEHDDFHMSRTVDLLPPRAGEEAAAVSAWITQPLEEGAPTLVLDGHLPDRPQPLDVEIDTRAAAALLALALGRLEPLAAEGPGSLLRDLLTETTGNGPTATDSDREGA